MKNKTKMILKEIKENLTRAWGWKKRDNLPLPAIKEQITNVVQLTKKMSGSVSLSRIYFPEKTSDFDKLKIEGIAFTKCIFSKATIQKYTFNKCSFVDCIFNGAQISDCEFHKCTFIECSFNKAKITRTYIDPASFKFSSLWCWYWPNVNVWFFQALYRNSKDMHQEKFAMIADKRFQFYRRYEYLRGQKPQLGKFILSFLYDYFLGYGYGIKNTLSVTIVMISTFAFLMKGHLNVGNHDFFSALYFSAVSFTTVGYGDLSPELEFIPMLITIFFLLLSMAWCAVVTAIIVKRIVK